MSARLPMYDPLLSLLLVTLQCIESITNSKVKMDVYIQDKLEKQLEITLTFITSFTLYSQKNMQSSWSQKLSSFRNVPCTAIRVFLLLLMQHDGREQARYSSTCNFLNTECSIICTGMLFL